MLEDPVDIGVGTPRLHQLQRRVRAAHLAEHGADGIVGNMLVRRNKDTASDGFGHDQRAIAVDRVRMAGFQPVDNLEHGSDPAQAVIGLGRMTVV